MTEFQEQLLHWTLSQAAEKKMCPHLKVLQKNIKVTNNLPGTIYIPLNQLPFKECSAQTKSPLLVSFRLQVTDHIQSIFAVHFCYLAFSETTSITQRKEHYFSSIILTNQQKMYSINFALLFFIVILHSEIIHVHI